MFALYYTDTQQFIAAPDRWVHAASLAKALSRETRREVAVIYNGTDGTTVVCCSCNGGQLDDPARGQQRASPELTLTTAH